jgi:hypothetical protein
MQLPVTDVFVTARVVSLPDDRCLIASFIQVPVDAVVAGIQYTVFEPTDMQVVAIEGYVLYLSREVEPVQAFCRGGPECFVVLYGFPVNLLVSLLIDMGGFLE